jgi:hypothetical protein
LHVCHFLCVQMQLSLSSCWQRLECYRMAFPIPSYQHTHTHTHTHTHREREREREKEGEREPECQPPFLLLEFSNSLVCLATAQGMWNCLHPSSRVSVIIRFWIFQTPTGPCWFVSLISCAFGWTEPPQSQEVNSQPGWAWSIECLDSISGSVEDTLAAFLGNIGQVRLQALWAPFYNSSRDKDFLAIDSFGERWNLGWNSQFLDWEVSILLCQLRKSWILIQNPDNGSEGQNLRRAWVLKV